MVKHETLHSQDVIRLEQKLNSVTVIDCYVASTESTTLAVEPVEPVVSTLSQWYVTPETQAFQERSLTAWYADGQPPLHARAPSTEEHRGTGKPLQERSLTAWYA